MKKSFIASIMSISINALLTLFFGFSMISTFVAMGSTSDASLRNSMLFSAIVSPLIMLLVIAALVFSIFTLLYRNKDSKKMRLFTIIAVVLNFVSMLLFLISLIGADVVTILMCILAIGLLIAINVLYILDLIAKEKGGKAVQSESKTESLKDVEEK